MTEQNNIGLGSFWGIGTTLYGKTDIHPDGSYIATKWFIIFLLPIFPLGSYRIYYKSNDEPLGVGLLLLGILGRKCIYNLTEVELNKKQIKSTYKIAYGLLLSFGIFIYILVSIPADFYLNYPYSIFIFILFPIIAPILWFKYRKNKKAPIIEGQRKFNEDDKKIIDEYANKLMKADKSQIDKVIDGLFKEFGSVIPYVDKNKYLKLNNKYYKFVSKKTKNIFGSIFGIKTYVLDVSTKEWEEATMPSIEEIKNGIWVNETPQS